MHCMYQWRHHDVHPDMHKAWHKGSEHVGRVVWLNVLRLILLYLFAVILAHSFVLSLFSPSALHMFIYVSLFALSAFGAVIMSLVLLFATGYVVMDDQKIWQAISAGWRLFWLHWLPSIEIGCFIAFLYITGLLLIALIAGVLLVPTAYIWVLLLAFIPSTFVASLFGVIIAVLVFGIVCASSLLTVAVTLLWSDLFLRMHHVGVPSTVKHFFRHWPFLHKHIGGSV